MHVQSPLVLSSSRDALTAGWQDSLRAIDFALQGGGWRQGDEVVAALAVVALVVVAFLGFVWIRAHARVQEKRLELIRELSAKGQLAPKAAERQLFPPSRWKAAVLVAAWFGLLGGAAMIITALANGWRYDFQELGAAGIAVFVVSLATLTAPMALAEVRRHTAG